jgi:hypothetical protein
MPHAKHSCRAGELLEARRWPMAFGGKNPPERHVRQLVWMVSQSAGFIF